MKAVLQRVKRAEVKVKGEKISEIGEGLLILLGVKKGDNEENAKELADTCAHLRIFEDENGKFNLSVKDVKGEALVVSQFTLLADTSRGRRPSFTDAEEPERAKRLYEFFIEQLKNLGVETKSGIFGERMLVSLDNNGPVTIILEE
jgi:D-tyrosyl-tRNA(Tyr) deacylase|uniref:D-aminoacyl-tRNA deacylase n=1 Tax=candidate division WOR-3 bacterium TaxID=2052148 RepID=A0A7V3VUC6_UNCW3